MERFSDVDEALQKRDAKRAEALIVRYLRRKLTAQERAALIIARARVRLIEGDADAALEEIAKARSIHPIEAETPQALETAGDSYFARFERAEVGQADRHDTAQALAAYDKLLADSPDYDNRGWVHYQRGRVLLTESRIDDAAAAFEAALAPPGGQRALPALCYERLGFIAFYERREPELALSFLDKAVASYPPDADRIWLIDVHTLRSRVLRDLQDYDGAANAANAAISAADGKSGMADALLNAAEILHQIDGREREAIAYLNEYISISKKPAGIDVTWSRVHEMLGDTYFKRGQLQQAVTAYEASLQFNPYTPWEVSLHYRIARTLYQLGEYERAIGAVAALLSAADADGQPIGDYRVFNILGNAHFALENYPQAAEAYQTALQIAPTSAQNLDKIKQYYQFALDLSRPV